MQTKEWEDIARRVGGLHDDGSEESSSEMALEALRLIVGEDRLVNAVHHYVHYHSGSEVVRNVLAILRPRVAMKECYKIYKMSSDLEERQAAVELLRFIADASALVWVPEFLKDEDRGIQSWAVAMIDQLLFANLCSPEDARAMLKIAIRCTADDVRERAAELAKELDSRESHT